MATNGQSAATGSDSGREVPPVRPLSAREANSPHDGTLYEGVPPHLAGPLQDWALGFFSGKKWLEHRVGATLRIGSEVDPAFAWGSNPGLSFLTGPVLLDVIDVALQLDTGLHQELLDGLPVWPSRSRASQLEQLDGLLADGGSAYLVQWETPPQLSRRIDPIVAESMDQVIQDAEPIVTQELRVARRNVYGMHPQPNIAYRSVVKAVEAVGFPLVLPNETAATLGKVIAHLKQGGHKWRFVLVNTTGDGGIEPLVQLLDRRLQRPNRRFAQARTSLEQTIP